MAPPPPQPWLIFPYMPCDSSTIVRSYLSPFAFAEFLTAFSLAVAQLHLTHGTIH
ncbi:hypothetical protein BC832DRAFT_556796 [Gaertneriomyces semiglobifer]|nr:hypothetical protein BC832DRAFT_556796 [Gaertneriomyces semiglobifer]